ncbi:MAG: hypothetical protein GX567_02285 [Clostridia bacterium]|nr:hypothetical protein [Clostridia bacterium]
MGNIARTLLKIGGSILAFIAAFVLFSNVMNKGNADMSATMKPATFPLVYIDINNMDVNCMHGYVGDMQGNYLRDKITPLQEQRSIPIKIKSYGPTIKGISFEVRSMDMQRLVEDTEVTEYSQEDADGYVSAVLYLKDLIEPETEYMLIIKLISGTGQEIKYYTRIFDPGALYLTEKFDFIMDFHNKIFDKEQAKELVKYMETNAEGDNSSFGNVNIHSNFEQLTWGDLNPKIVTKENVSIKEIDSEYANVTIEYRVSAGSDLFDVREFYRVRRGSERIYLMDYERTMDQIFDTDHTVLVKDQLLFGISSEEPQMKESDDGSKLCFVKQNALYSYDNTEGYLARLFSFYDDENNDERTIYSDHGIKILSVEDDGEIRFLVYGYMNRGKHEGEVGSAVYKYIPVSNSIEEEIFIPYSKSYELLKQDIAYLSYVNKQEKLYMLSGQTIYEIDLTTKTCKKVVSGLLPNRFVVSEDDSLVAWQEGENLYNSDKIILDTLKNARSTEIKSEPGTTIIPLGFMDEDFIYGLARKVTLPMTVWAGQYFQCIQSASKINLEKY